jgi:uncharacterized protein YecA (UPF0149 family)
VVEDRLAPAYEDLAFFADRDLAESYHEAAEPTDEDMRALADEVIERIPEALVTCAEVGATLAETYATPREPARREAKVGRNDPCPCGSGKKYKKCCGAG